MYRVILFCCAGLTFACGDGSGGGLSSSQLFGPTDAGEQRSDPKGAIWGLVVSEVTWGGVAGASVLVDDAVTTSGPDGRYALDDLRPGLLNAQVTAPGYWDGVFQVQVPAGTTQIDFELSLRCELTPDCPSGWFCNWGSCKQGTGPAALRGRITSLCSEKPLSARVQLGHLVTCSNPDDGTYSFDGLVGGDDPDLVVEKSGYRAWRIPASLNAGENVLDVQLQPTDPSCDDPPDVHCACDAAGCR